MRILATLPSLSPSSPATATPRRTSTPLSRCRSAARGPISGPSARSNGTGSISTTTTSAPRPLAVAATSEPMNPAPITATRGRLMRSARNARQSSMVRSTCTPARSGGATAAGSRRAAAPVAMTTASASSCSPPSRVTVWVDGSSAVACRPNSHSASRSSAPRSRARSGSHVPARTCLESGGRSNGRPASALTIRMRPSNPSRRSASAVRSPARDPPTTVTERWATGRHRTPSVPGAGRPDEDAVGGILQVNSATIAAEGKSSRHKSHRELPAERLGARASGPDTAGPGSAERAKTGLTSTVVRTDLLIRNCMVSFRNLALRDGESRGNSVGRILVFRRKMLGALRRR